MSNTASVVPFRKPDTADAAVITFDDVSLHHEGRALLNSLSAEIGIRGVTCVIGPNGAGKTLLLRAAMGLVKTTHGTITFGDGYEAPALVFQRPVLLRRSVRGNLLHALKVANVPRMERAGRLAELLVTADLTRLAENPARTLSGGEQQRLAIVRALASRPKLLLLDEPTASLDPTATKAIEELINRTAESGVKVILVTHNQAQANRLCQDVLFLHHGQVIEHAPAETFFKSPNTDVAKAYLAGELVL